MIRITHYTREEFLPIRSLLHVAIEEFATYQDEYIGIMVHDAQKMIEDSTYRYRANKRVYRYSSYISKYDRAVIKSMDVQHLTKDDYIKLLSIFEAL